MQMDARYSIINGRLTIQDTSESQDAGNYFCIASNVVGKVLSNTVTVDFGCK